MCLRNKNVPVSDAARAVRHLRPLTVVVVNLGYYIAVAFMLTWLMQALQAKLVRKLLEGVNTRKPFAI